MKQTTYEPFTLPTPSPTSPPSGGGGGGDPLTEVIRQGAKTLLARAVEAEVTAWIDDHAHVTDEHGHRQVVRNGRHRERSVLTGVGPVEVAPPRVNDRRPEAQREKFVSKVLPPYLRKAKTLDELIPWLYLKGVSTGDFGEALAALLGPDAPGLSALTVVRLKQTWQDDYRQWSQRDLTGKRYVYVWAAPRKWHPFQRPPGRGSHSGGVFSC